MSLINNSTFLLLVSVILNATAFVRAPSTGWHQRTQNHKQEQRPSSPSSISTSSLDTSIFQTNSAINVDDPRLEPRLVHQIKLSLPMGLVLEEMDPEPSFGVVIVGITPEGNAAKSNAEVFSNIKAHDNTLENVSDKCICIRDKIVSINGISCCDKSFDNIVDIISNSGSNAIALEVGRVERSTVLNYDNGICIAAKPGESYGFLARKCNVDIDYECRSGSCQTCKTLLNFPTKRNQLNDVEGVETSYTCTRSILHCIGRVPRDYEWLHVCTRKDKEFCP